MVNLIFVPRNYYMNGGVNGTINNTEDVQAFNRCFNEEFGFINHDSFYFIPTENYVVKDSNDGYSKINNEMCKLNMDYLDPIIESVNPKELEKGVNNREFKASAINFIPRFGAFVISAVSLNDRILGLQNYLLKTYLGKIDYNEKCSEVVFDTLDELSLVMSKNCSYVYDEFHDKKYDTERLFNILFDIKFGLIERNEDKIRMFSEDYEDFMDMYKDIKIFN